ncbi:Archaeal primase DnaG/twinkle, TOPRIM domain [uncultured Caudovirales phage]|uniref:DNA helicase/primase n=1 Tax=uncultured Caudovirales phage TaxID=2100421 RepID=A0A6J5P8L6_9CAUD|nr:Archaeal primase DnaG/twinkle, TOPRIM domain [uncultured Caudovirales phage]
MTDDATVISKGPCPSDDCGSSDAFTLYSDGHGYCFSCKHYEHGDGESAPSPRETNTKGPRMDFIQGETKALTQRGINEDTCRFFGYEIGWHGEKQVHLANYRDPAGNSVVAQKVRDRNKDFHIRGEIKDAGLYGQWLWRDQGKMIVITEGEIDALTVSQLQLNKWPVVSIPTGASGAKKSLSAQLAWLLRFETVVLFFDDDKAGAEAVAECAPLFPPGRVKIAKIPGHKDANSALMAGEAKLVIDAIWGAKEFRPDGIVTVGDVREAALAAPRIGRSWPWDTLTKATLGRRPGEVYLFGAGTGVGKSEVFDQIIAHVVKVEDRAAGVFKFEQPVAETVKRIAGKCVGRRFHIPDSGWDQKELVAVVDQLQHQNKLHMYDCFGQCDWDIVESHIRYLHAAHGVEDFFIDHLTAMAETGDDERGSLETIMKAAATLAQELGICLYMISHLTTPDGTPHEEGGRVMIRHFKGSRAIGFWSHFMFGLERDQQHEDPKLRSITTFRCLKDRYTGQSVGQTFYLGYDLNTGILNETEMPTAADDFDDQTKGKSSSKEDAPPF